MFIINMAFKATMWERNVADDIIYFSNEQHPSQYIHRIYVTQQNEVQAQLYHPDQNSSYIIHVAQYTTNEEAHNLANSLIESLIERQNKRPQPLFILQMNYLDDSDANDKINVFAKRETALAHAFKLMDDAETADQLLHELSTTGRASTETKLYQLIERAIF